MGSERNWCANGTSRIKGCESDWHEYLHFCRASANLSSELWLGVLKGEAYWLSLLAWWVLSFIIDLRSTELLHILPGQPSWISITSEGGFFRNNQHCTLENVLYHFQRNRVFILSSHISWSECCSKLRIHIGPYIGPCGCNEAFRRKDSDGLTRFFKHRSARSCGTAFWSRRWEIRIKTLYHLKIFFHRIKRDLWLLDTPGEF